MNIDTVSAINGIIDLTNIRDEISSSTIVDVTHHVDLQCCKLHTIPIKFNVVDEFFDVRNNELTSMKNAPVSVGMRDSASFLVSNNLLTSFEHSPKEVGGNYFIEANEIVSLHDIHKHVKRINCYLYIGLPKIEDSMLGVLLILGLNRVQGGSFLLSSTKKKLLSIINKYIKDNDKSKIFRCQKELIDNGFEEYAKL